MSRKLPFVALFIIALHVCEVLIFGTSATGALIANSLQLVACAIGTAERRPGAPA